MKNKREIHAHLGEYIHLLQRLVPVDGRLLTNEEVAKRTGLSLSTYKRVKKGSKRTSRPTMPCCGSTYRCVPAVASCPLISTSAAFTATWRTITGPVVTDAVTCEAGAVRTVPVFCPACHPVT